MHISDQVSSSLGALIVRDGKNIGSGTEEVVPVGQLSKIRCRRRAKPARPYICRFRALPVPGTQAGIGHLTSHRAGTVGPSDLRRGLRSERCRRVLETNTFRVGGRSGLAPAGHPGVCGGSRLLDVPAGRYRAAALALETGRALALSALVVARGHDPQYVELPRYDRASVATLLEGMLPGPATTDRGGCRRDFFVDSAGEEVDATRVGVLVWLWRNGLDIIMLAHAHGRIVTLIPIGLLSLLPVHAAGVSEDRHAGMFSAVRYAPERPHPQSLSSNRHRVRIRPSVVARRRCAGRTRTPAGIAPLLRGPRDDRDRGDLGGCQARATPRARLPLGGLPPPADDHGVWHIACHGACALHRDRRQQRSSLRAGGPRQPPRTALVEELDLHRPVTSNQTVSSLALPCP